MAQLTIYLDTDTAERARRASSEEGESLSRWVVSLIRRELSEHWPDSVRELAGQWKDFPSIGEIRADYGTDAGREEL